MSYSAMTLLRLRRKLFRFRLCYARPLVTLQVSHPILQK